jgi:hypothetical protein
MASTPNATTPAAACATPTPAQTVEALVKLGVLIADAAKGEKVDWSTWLGSSDYQTVKASVLQLARLLGPSSVTRTVAAIQQKQQALLAQHGDKLENLPTDKLLQYSALGNLKFRLQGTQGFTGDMASFGNWLLNDALPVLLKVAPIVIPLLL